ncbi:hypothetical protein [Halostella sp. PRR32]|uniref:hypothetical protein n=1 Tax=Halostella sp. PRR32 TaxID=3098147 RepID=UPI002B1DDF11|nr:hypothetical protein [Halostella sp. PRR32]
MSKLDWPEGFERTPPEERGEYDGDITIGHRAAFESIVDELERWGATGVDVKTAGQHYVNDPQIPHKSADPEDPGVAVFFRREDEPADDGYAIACDRYESQRENGRAIALYARRKRLAEKCGVTTADSEFETARLPPADDDAVAAPPAPSEGDILDEEPHEVLDVSPDAPDEIVRAAFKAQVRDLEGHPDTGGSAGRFEKLKKAREALLDK